jgi:hypothetical protein
MPKSRVYPRNLDFCFKCRADDLLWRSVKLQFGIALLGIPCGVTLRLFLDQTFKSTHENIMRLIISMSPIMVCMCFSIKEAIWLPPPPFKFRHTFMAVYLYFRRFLRIYIISPLSIIGYYGVCLSCAYWKLQGRSVSLGFIPQATDEMGAKPGIDEVAHSSAFLPAVDRTDCLELGHHC